ncbi:MAG: endolytic transglycosylase MltG [bacterium]|nr:endolytic transglycosylase MltG [bacterium]
MKRRLALGVLAVAVATALASVWAWRHWTHGPDAGGRPAQIVRVPRGMTLAAAADTLVARRLLADRRYLLVGARLTGRGRSLRSGLYELDASLAPRDLLAILTSGRSMLVRVTIPEGLDAEETADIVVRETGCDRDRFLAAADSLAREAVATAGLMAPRTVAAYDSLLAGESARVPRRLRWSEGYLAPDTYLFAADATAGELAAHLVATQSDRLDRLVIDGEYGKHALLTLASIVEAEARRADERTRIAAVYRNRLSAGWRLEADPTVAFILVKKGQRLFYRDLEAQSAWNTYRRRGLPPGPIGSPGVAALAAAAAPDTSCDAFYFVSDGADGHVFSRTAAEHEEAVREFRRLRRNERR